MPRKAAVLVIAGTVFGLNRGAGETVQGALSQQSPDTNIVPKYWDEVQSTAISPEGFPHELFVLRFAIPDNSVPKYENEPIQEFISPEGWPHELFILQFIPVQ